MMVLGKAIVSVVVCQLVSLSRDHKRALCCACAARSLACVAALPTRPMIEMLLRCWKEWW